MEGLPSTEKFNLAGFDYSLIADSLQAPEFLLIVRHKKQKEIEQVYQGDDLMDLFDKAVLFVENWVAYVDTAATCHVR